MPQTTVVELVEEAMIATSPTIPVNPGDVTVQPEDDIYTREEVTFPKHDVWEEW